MGGENAVLDPPTLGTLRRLYLFSQSQLTRAHEIAKTAGYPVSDSTLPDAPDPCGYRAAVRTLKAVCGEMRSVVDGSSGDADFETFDPAALSRMLARLSGQQPRYSGDFSPVNRVRRELYAAFPGLRG